MKDDHLLRYVYCSFQSVQMNALQCICARMCVFFSGYFGLAATNLQ
jgi:hypothetical protein